MNEIPDPVQFTRSAAGQEVQSGVGVLLVNLGTPDATDAASVRRYLREFPHDRRVIEEDTLLWKLVLNAIILPLRPAGSSIVVDWAMRYGNPSIRSRLAALAAQGCARGLLVPLYPQYAAAT